ncbi:MAG TPA: alpha/beta hydrolase [Flavisolibacter sp.]|nr:alpha/beta hydrolase [Flavisolibacter sp.]
MKRIVFSVGLLLSLVFTKAQEFIPLWPAGKKPNTNGKVVTDSIYNERYWRVGTPGMWAFPALESENSGAAVLICPGGGYTHLTHLFNGFNFAHWFNAHGISAFVLLYRLPGQEDLKVRELGPLTDAQRALKILKANADKWAMAKNKIGVMGISAGGHVATTLGTHANDVSAIHDSLDTVSVRPDFMLLLSPVVTMGKQAHAGSRKVFLGADTTKAMIEKFSNELQVTTSTPPTFIVHAQNDSTVNVRNSLLFYTALVEKGVQASLHVFPQGGHGIGLIDNPGSTDMWLDLLDLWLREKRFVEPKKK